MWEDADNFLNVFVDAISKKFGMSVSLLLVGPLGMEQGKISMRRYVTCDHESNDLFSHFVVRTPAILAV